MGLLGVRRVESSPWFSRGTQTERARRGIRTAHCSELSSKIDGRFLRSFGHLRFLFGAGAGEEIAAVLTRFGRIPMVRVTVSVDRSRVGGFSRIS
jgi:hypothetical protein